MARTKPVLENPHFPHPCTLLARPPGAPVPGLWSRFLWVPLAEFSRRRLGVGRVLEVRGQSSHTDHSYCCPRPHICRGCRSHRPVTGNQRESAMCPRVSRFLISTSPTSEDRGRVSYIDIMSSLVSMRNKIILRSNTPSNGWC